MVLYVGECKTQNQIEDKYIDANLMNAYEKLAPSIQKSFKSVATSTLQNAVGVLN
jgi:hypothetical protein